MSRLSLLVVSLAIGLCPIYTADAQIYRWDNGQVIPGTEWITPGPGVSLPNWNTADRNLRYADLSGELNLSGANFFGSWLDHVDFQGANLTNAKLVRSTLTDANLSGATVTGASFGRDWYDQQWVGTGLTQHQLQSTASYQAKNLQGIGLWYSDLTGWDFHGQNLTSAYLYSSIMTGANLSGANLTSADLESSTLTGANLGGAVVTGAALGNTTSGGFTQAQLQSTASYQANDLHGIGLWNNDLTRWDFSGQNLASAYLISSTLTNANLSGAVVTGASFSDTTARGFTSAQLYSTASYQTKDLHGIFLGGNDLTGWDFHGQNLTSAYLNSSTLTNANFGGAVVTGAIFRDTTARGFTSAQLYSTASYQAKDLHGIGFGDTDLTGWDFSGQNLTNADLYRAVITDASFNDTTSRGFTRSQLESTASYQSQNLQGIQLAKNDLTGWNFTGQNLALSNLSNADLSEATLSRAVLTGAQITGTSFGNTTAKGFTESQLRSTASYQAKDLRGIGLVANDLRGWDFTGQNLSGANVAGSTLSNANLTGADLTAANLSRVDLRGAEQVNLNGAVLSKTIEPTGQLAGLRIADGDQFLIRSYAGNPKLNLGPVPVTVHDEFTVASTGQLTLLIGEPPATNAVFVSPGTPVQLGGTLNISFGDYPYEAFPLEAFPLGIKLKLFDWPTPLAADNQFAKVTSNWGYGWDVSQLYTTGEVTLADVSSDLDDDRDVDSADLLSFETNWTGSAPPVHDKTWDDGDSDGDGDVDSRDLEVFLYSWTGAKPNANLIPARPNIGDSDNPDLIYDPATGNVKLMPGTGAKNKIVGFVLATESNAFKPEADGVFTGRTPWSDAVYDNLPFQIGSADIGGVGTAEGAGIDLGNILPTGLDYAGLRQLLTQARVSWKRGEGGTGVLDLPIIPEPNAQLLFSLGAMSVMRTRRRK